MVAVGSNGEMTLPKMRVVVVGDPNSEMKIQKLGVMVTGMVHSKHEMIIQKPKMVEHCKAEEIVLRFPCL